MARECRSLRSFTLSTKRARSATSSRSSKCAKPCAFEVRARTAPIREGTVEARQRRDAASCVVSAALPLRLHARAKARPDVSARELMAIVAKGDAGHGSTISPRPPITRPSCAAARSLDDAPDDRPPDQALGFRVQAYGLTKYRDLFTPRQLVALTTFTDLVARGARRSVARRRRRRGVRRRGGDLPRPSPSSKLCGLQTRRYVLWSPARDQLEQPSPDRRCRWYGTSPRPIRSANAAGDLGGLVDASRVAIERSTGCRVGERRRPQLDATTPSTLSRRRGLHRSALLRQHRLRRSVGLLLRLAAALARRDLPRLCSRTLLTPKAQELVADAVPLRRRPRRGRAASSRRA